MRDDIQCEEVFEVQVEMAPEPVLAEGVDLVASLIGCVRHAIGLGRSSRTQFMGLKRNNIVRIKFAIYLPL